MNNDKNIYMKNDFEQVFVKSLKSYGYLFPTTDEEVEAFENENDINSIKLPKSLQNPSEILKKGRANAITKKEVQIIDLNTTESMKMAARKGEDIPDNIMNKMDKDRENAENEDQQ